MIAIFGKCREGKMQATAYLHETGESSHRMIDPESAVDA